VINTKNKIEALYKELVEIARRLDQYYDIDKIKPYSVCVWTKGKNGENVFDILANEIVFYSEDHAIIEGAKPIVEKIQSKLKEIEQCL